MCPKHHRSDTTTQHCEVCNLHDTIQYSKLNMYMKNLTRGYETTKADVFTTEPLVKFMTEATDKDHLLH